MTFMTIPSTISGGPSIFQVRIGSGEVLSAGDEADLLLAFYDHSYAAHIGSYSTREGAERAWSVLDRKSAALGKATAHAVYPVDFGPPKGKLYRLVAGQSTSKAEVQKLCDALKAEGAYCLVLSVKS